MAPQAIGVGPILRPNGVLLHQEKHPGSGHGHAQPLHKTFLDLDVLESEGFAQAAQDVDVECSRRRDLLDRRILAGQIHGTDFRDLWIVKDRSQRGAEPADVFLVLGNEDVEILRGPRQADEAEGYRPHDLVSHSFVLKRPENGDDRVRIHNRGV